MKVLDQSILDQLDVCFWCCKANELSSVDKTEAGAAPVKLGRNNYPVFENC